MECLDIATKRRGTMELNVDERRAVGEVSAEVGSYLDRLGKTDLATMTEQEWLGFIGHAYACVCAKVHEQWARDVPF
jgi:hypothetical protein